MPAFVRARGAYRVNAGAGGTGYTAGCNGLPTYLHTRVYVWTRGSATGARIEASIPASVCITCARSHRHM